jgi:hypothetical protein
MSAGRGHHKSCLYEHLEPLDSSVAHQVKSHVILCKMGSVFVTDSNRNSEKYVPLEVGMAEKTPLFYRIWGSHSGVYEKYCRLGYIAV